MKKYYLIITVALLISLFIYVFYRTENTVVNQLFITIFSLEEYVNAKEMISKALPLNNFVVYSLPGALWVFCITLFSKYFYLPIGEIKINGVFIPIIWAIGLEFLQLLQITNGSFDIIDILSVLFSWLLAYKFINPNFPYQNIFHHFSLRTTMCISTYAIIYLAHVYQ